MKRIILPLIIFLLLFSVVFTSCNKAKEESNDPQGENQTAEESFGGQNTDGDKAQSNNKATTTTKKGGTAVSYPTYATTSTATTTTTGGGTNTPTTTTKGSGSGDGSSSTTTTTTGSGSNSGFHWQSSIPNIPSPDVQTPSLPQLPQLPSTP